MKKIFLKRIKTKENKGFTLIELLVIISILGLISSIVIASTNTSRTKTRDAKRIEDMKNIQIALEMYYDKHNHYPIKYSSSIGPENGNSGWSKDEWTSNSLEENLEPYIASLPKEETFGHYFYNSVNNGAIYGLGCSMESPDNFNLVNNDGGYYNDDNYYYEVGEAPVICKDAGKDWFYSAELNCP